MFLVLDHEGTLIGIVMNESQHKDMVSKHLALAISKTLPVGLSEETRQRLAKDRFLELYPRCKMIRG